MLAQKNQITHEDVVVQDVLVGDVHDGVPGVEEVEVAVGEAGLGGVKHAEGHAGLDLLIGKLNNKKLLRVDVH